MTDAAAVATAVDAATTANVDTGADTGELKKLIAQRDELKRKLREIEPLAAKAKEFEQAQMSESQKLAARIAELEPLAAKSDRMEKVVGALLEQELMTVPEDMRDVIPKSLSSEEQLDWLRQAKSKGLFKVTETAAATPPKDSPLLNRPNASGKTMKRGAFDGLNAYARADFIRSGGVIID